MAASSPNSDDTLPALKLKLVGREYPGGAPLPALGLNSATPLRATPMRPRGVASDGVADALLPPRKGMVPSI